MGSNNRNPIWVCVPLGTPYDFGSMENQLFIGCAFSIVAEPNEINIYLLFICLYSLPNNLKGLVGVDG
jgi:hypothetical protein